MESKNSDSRHYFDLIKNVHKLPTYTISALGHTAHMPIIPQFRCTLPDTEYVLVKECQRNSAYACTITKAFLISETDFNFKSTFLSINSENKMMQRTLSDKNADL